MLTVIKRSGKEEVFNIEKIKTTATAASDELHKPLNASDIHNLASSVEKHFSGKEKVTALEIYKTLLAVMHEEGFSELADAYEKNKANKNR